LDVNAEILDIGCGAGYDLIQLGRRLGDHSRLVGLDQSTEAIFAAQEATFGDLRFQFEQYAVDEQLPWATNSFDVVMANNFLECVQDKQQVISEIHRVLRPGGQVICAHFDWDTQVFNGSNKQLIRKILQAYSDWQQPWMPNCDGWVGRRLWGEFAGCGLFDGGIETYVMTNISYDESNFGYQRVRDFQELIKSGAISQFEYDYFCDEQEDLATRNAYFYSVTLYAYHGKKRHLRLPLGSN
jgi:SAM-dependent methyltransferase